MQRAQRLHIPVLQIIFYPYYVQIKVLIRNKELIASQHTNNDP